jgi:hypothetical protein
MYKLKQIWLPSILVFIVSIGNAQVLTEKQKPIVLQQNNLETNPISSLESLSITTNNLYIVEKINLEFNNQPTATLSEVNTSIISKYTLQQNLVLPTAFTPIVTTGFEQKLPIAFVQIPKYILQNGQVVQLNSYKLNVVNGERIKKTRGIRTYAANSILANGLWQKLAISQTGIHKVDYNFVKNNLGITPENINTSLIKVCGKGGAMLSENNAEIPLDDVPQTALQLVGMEDGKWDANDYILFYAEGPHQLIKDSINQKFTHQFNIYSEQAIYLINFDASDIGLRITQQGSLSGSNKNITTFNDYVFHEKDSSNLGKVGKLWWGDMLGNKVGVPKSKQFIFDMPNLVPNGDVQIETYLGNKAVLSSCNFDLTASILDNNNLINAQANFDNIIGSTGPNLYAPFIVKLNEVHTLNGSGDKVKLDLQYICSEDQAIGYINYIGINAKRNLILSNSQMNFRSWESVGPTSIAQYSLTAPSSTKVWDVTNKQKPILLNTVHNNGLINFSQEAIILHEFVAFNGSQFAVPTMAGVVGNQNLHNSTPVDYLIITHPSFEAQANQLASIHQQKENLRTLVVTTNKIYNEFNSGVQDIAAIRNFIKMYYDKATTATDLPKYVLLFGDASYDYKDRIKDNSNFVLSRESDESIETFSAYVSDDFFGMLDDNENINNPQVPNTIDVGIGRFVCGNIEEAATLVQKVSNYYSVNSLGDWRLNQTFCADDRDYAQHVLDAEIMAKEAAKNQPNYNLYKIYVDAFPIFQTPAGNRAPQAKQAIDAQIFNGTLMVNYNGHGGTTGWCEERILNTADISGYNNAYKLPIFLTATCDFAPYNNPQNKSCGEQLFLHKKGGAIALLTTTAVVFQYQNQIMNHDYWKDGFKPMANGKMPTIGDALRLSKNRTYITPSAFDIFTNFRKFVLLGDPALMPAFPKDKVILDSVNGVQLSGNIDTLNALNAYTLSGHVSDAVSGNLKSDFNGTVSISIFDKPKTLTTLQYVPVSSKVNYSLQNAIVFKGKATVKNGKWSVYFIVPKDIDYSFGPAKISMYAHNNETDAAGSESVLVKIGGSNGNNITDNKGPDIKPFMNNNKFINGGLTAPNSTLYVELFDENGINTTGTSVGHDLVAYLDDNLKDPIVLNNFYEGTRDNYKSGVIRYPFKDLSEGKHSLTIRAWDVVNNSNTASVDFVVSSTNTAKIDRLLNYPNPFTTSTNFSFEHNFPNEPLYVTIQIFTTSGQVVKTIQQYVNSEGSRIDDIHWDGKDQLGDKLGRGVYLYRIYYKTITGISTSKYEKLVIL